MQDCIFCKIVRKEAPSHTIWEDDDHIAFLSIFPNTDAFSVVIPRKHTPSYAFANSDAILSALVLAAKRVGTLLDARLPDVGRTGLIFEGFGVDHLHAKLFPMHGTKELAEWKPLKSNVDKFFERYEGYISSHDYKRADDAKLAELARRIRGAN